MGDEGVRDSPYHNAPVSKWAKITKRLLSRHPLSSQEIVDAVRSSWDAIFESRIGQRDLVIGQDIFPEPQIMGFLLHELIPIELAARHPGEWRRCENSGEKDLVYIPDPRRSVEIKTSSHKQQIFSNRSFAQKPSKTKKDKDGYYLAVNFQKFAKAHESRPDIRLIRFGWLDHSDWTGQDAPTGQQAKLRPEVELYKFLTLYKLPG